MTRAHVDEPVFSIVTPVYEPPVNVLAETIQSVIDQTFDRWELILVDDCSPNPEVRRTLADFARRDPRVRVIERAENGHIVAASNDGIQAARGDFIALLDHDDLLVPDALESVFQAIERFDDLDYIYSDEDKIDAEGRRYAAFAKPDWSPERLRAQNYCCHFSVLRTSLVRDVGGFREGYDGSQDHDIILRVSERARRVFHIPRVLYHWRVVPGSAAGDPTAKPYAIEAGRRAVQDQLDRLGIRAQVELGPGRGHYLTRHELPAERRVSIVIAGDEARGLVWGRRREFLREAVRSARALTRHRRAEVVIVHDEQPVELDQAWLDDRDGVQVRLVRCPTTASLSERLNVGAMASEGDRLVFLDQATEIVSDNWLDELLGPLEEESVGVTGPKTLGTDGRIASCGLARHPKGFANIGFGADRDHPGEFGMLWASREVIALGPACIAMRRDVFLSVGGFSEQVDDAFIHLDVAFKVRRTKLRAVAVATCEMFHFGNPRRLITRDAPGLRSVQMRWGHRTNDPYVRAYRGLPAVVRIGRHDGLAVHGVRGRAAR